MQAHRSKQKFSPPSPNHMVNLITEPPKVTISCMHPTRPTRARKPKAQIDLNINIPKSPRMDRKISGTSPQRLKATSPGTRPRSPHTPKRPTPPTSPLPTRKILSQKPSVILPERVCCPAGSLCGSLSRTCSLSPKPRRRVLYEECLVDPQSLGPAVIIGQDIPDVLQIEDATLPKERVEFIKHALSRTPHTPQTDFKIPTDMRPRSATAGASVGLGEGPHWE